MKRLSTSSNLTWRSWRGSTNRSRSHLCLRTVTLSTQWKLYVLDGSSLLPLSIAPSMRLRTRSSPGTQKASLRNSSMSSGLHSIILTSHDRAGWLPMSSNRVSSPSVILWGKISRLVLHLFLLFIAFFFFFKCNLCPYVTTLPQNCIVWYHACIAGTWFLFLCAYYSFICIQFSFIPTNVCFICHHLHRGTLCSVL